MFDPTTFTGFHTWLSLLALAAGLPVAVDLLRGIVAARWTEVYLVTAIATSATGFGFPFTSLLPSHVVGVISLVLLGAAILALYVFDLKGGWRRIYAVTAMLGFYLLAFVALAQAFAKVPALRALAPTQAEPPFAIAQGVLLLVFIALTWRAAQRATAATMRTA